MNRFIFVYLLSFTHAKINAYLYLYDILKYIYKCIEFRDLRSAEWKRCPMKKVNN